MLDSAGRLQLPQEYRELLNIGNRVELDCLPDGILVRPVEGRGLDQSNGNSMAADRASLYGSVDSGTAAKPGFLNRLRRTLGRRQASK